MTDLAAPAPITILGAGLTGLSCAYHLGRAATPPPWLLVEREDRVGGHAKSHRHEGYTFDVTGHWLHLRDPEMQALVDRLFAPGDWARVERETRIWSHHAELAYPFQANLHGLPLEVVNECLVAYVESQREEAAGRSQPRNFTEFVTARFGAGMARHFFVPYNQKLWGMSPDALTADWVSRFLPLPDTAQILGGAIGLRQEGLGYNAHFMYPKAGGIDALPEALAKAVRDQSAKGEHGALLTGHALESIDLGARRLQLSGESSSRPFDRLVSTLPLPILIERIEDAPSEIREAAAALRWVSWRYLDLATRSQSPRDWHWCYVPETRYPFFRVGCYTNAMPSMAPEGCGSFYVELSDREGAIDMPGVFEGLAEMGAIRGPEDVAFAHERRIEFAYVVFDDAHAQATATLHAWLESQKIRSCGRYGAWIYNSMEDSMLQGRDAARWALTGAPARAK